MTTYNPELMTKCAQEQSAAGGKRAVTCSKPRMMEREDWNQRYAASDFIWTDEANRFLIAEMAGQAPGLALDMAAGEGVITSYSIHYTKLYEGISPDSGRLSLLP